MTTAGQFLTALAQAVSTMSLYPEGHPARARALDTTHAYLLELQEVTPRSRFTFLGPVILVDERPLRELRGWEWGSRFASVGIQRLELLGPVKREDLDVFLEEAYLRVTGAPVNSADARPGRPTNIRWGLVTPRGDEGEGPGASQLAKATLGYSLADEVKAVDWIHGELKDSKELHLLEAESTVRSLSIAMHGDQAFVIPLLRMKRYDQYTTTHAMNVSVLAMSLAENIGLAPAEVRSFGISGLLHDLGKVIVPEEILNKPGKLTEKERMVMNQHPAEGARIILETEDQLDLAATVAYEHHIKLNGGGYPTLAHPWTCHQASDLVHVCDVFDALRTDRPYRSGWASERVLSYIEEGAGKEFEPDLARAFVHMMRTWEQRVIEVETPDKPEEAAGATGDDEGAAATEAEFPPEEIEPAWPGDLEDTEDDLSWE